VDRLYLAFGEARHDRKESFGERDVQLACIEQAGLGRDLLDRAVADPSVKEEVAQEEATIAQAGGFGVPTLVIQGFEPMFGPVIHPVPTGEEAGVLWDHTEYLIKSPNFYEFKREVRH
jgi:hypothetical protein